MKRIGQMEPWLGKEETKAVTDYLNSGGWLTEFTKTRELEQLIADYIGSRHVAMVNNGTMSLIIALMALGIGSGDEVIIPDYTMIATAFAVSCTKAKPVFVDVDRNDLCMDFDMVEQAITRQTKVILHVSINGRSGRIRDFRELAQKHGIWLIEDAAQSLGSMSGGKYLGTIGVIGSFSFSTAKVITTGQGGALVTDDEQLYKTITMVKNFGRPVDGVDYHEIMGINSKFTDLQSVIGIEQMKKLTWRLKRKKEIYRLYQKLLRNLEQVQFIKTNLDECAPWFNDILLPDKETKENLSRYLKDRGIGSRPFYPVINAQAPYSHVQGNFKNAESISARGLWLPSSSFLSDEDVERVSNEVMQYFYKT